MFLTVMFLCTMINFVFAITVITVGGNPYIVMVSSAIMGFAVASGLAGWVHGTHR